MDTTEWARQEKYHMSTYFSSVLYHMSRYNFLQKAQFQLRYLHTSSESNIKNMRALSMWVSTQQKVSIFKLSGYYINTTLFF